MHELTFPKTSEIISSYALKLLSTSTVVEMCVKYLVKRRRQRREMSKKSSQVNEEYDDDLALYTSEAKESAYDTPRGMGLDLSGVECLDDENPNIQETPITVSTLLLEKNIL